MGFPNHSTVGTHREFIRYNNNISLARGLSYFVHTNCHYCLHCIISELFFQAKTMIYIDPDLHRSLWYDLIHLSILYHNYSKNAPVSPHYNPHFNGYIIKEVNSLIRVECFEVIAGIFPIQGKLKCSDFSDYFISLIAACITIHKAHQSNERKNDNTN